MKPVDRFVDITLHDNVVVTVTESRQVLEDIGIGGEIVLTPGHSDDSVSLLLDNGFAFTGDLPHPSMATDDNTAAVHRAGRSCGGAARPRSIPVTARCGRWPYTLTHRIDD